MACVVCGVQDRARRVVVGDTVISLLQELASGLSWHQVFGYMSRRCVKLDGSLPHEGKVMCLHASNGSAFRYLICVVWLHYFSH